MSNENKQSHCELGQKLSELSNHQENDPSELLKYRFLCREGVLGLYGQTGIGKSSFSMQCMIQWALGLAAFGIVPRHALKSLLIQAENDDGDIAEMRDGVCEGLGLSPEEKQRACENIIVIHEDSKVAGNFFNSLVKPALGTHKPDMLWIDCALSYLGGDAISQEVVGVFLRVELNPLLKSNQCGCVIVHHTNKSGNGDSAYAGSGSAEWANMPRAILVLSPAGKGAFDLTAAKRGRRLKWKMPDGETLILKKRLIHSSLEGRIFWEEVDLIDNKSSKDADNKIAKDQAILQCVPQEGTIEKKDLIKTINEQTGMGLNKIGPLINQLVDQKVLFAIQKQRDNARPAVHISRTPDKYAAVKEMMGLS